MPDILWIVRHSLLLGVLFAAGVRGEAVYIAPPDESNDDIEIVAEEDRTIFEYRQNGVLMMIKIVPKVGRPYYMVPADGSPHFTGLDHSKKLYPQWVIVEW